MNIADILRQAAPLVIDAVEAYEDPTKTDADLADAGQRVATVLASSGHPAAAQIAAVAPALVQHAVPALVLIAQHPNPAALLKSFGPLLQLGLSKLFR